MSDDPLDYTKDRWKNRRFMAYMSLFSIILCLFGAILFPELFLKSKEIIQTVLTGLFGVVLAYFGLASTDHIMMDRNRRRFRRSDDFPGAMG